MVVPNMAHSLPSATPSNTKEWEPETWVAPMTSLSNFRHHVPGDNRQPAPSAYMTLRYNLHYTLSATHYHAPHGHWVTHGTDSLLPADYAPPPHNQGLDTYARKDEPDDPTSGARGNASPWTHCSPSAAATRALVGRCIALPSGRNGPGGSPRTGGAEGHAVPPAEGGPPKPKETHPPTPHHPTALPVHGGSLPHGAAVAGPAHPSVNYPDLTESDMPGIQRCFLCTLDYLEEKYPEVLEQIWTPPPA